MELFLENITSFPTILFTIPLVVVVLYWFTASMGLVEVDVLDLEVDADVNADGGNLDGLAGLLMKLGLNGVPVTLVLSLIILIAWSVSFLCYHFFLQFMPFDVLRYVIGIGVVVGVLVAGVVITAQLIKPLRPLFKKASAATVKSILGQVAQVRTSRVTASFGEAVLDDQGAGLILKVRCEDEERFKKGDRVVLLEYLSNENAYRVISEEEFLTGC